MKVSVAEFLKREYGGEFEAGKKHICPVCTKTTMSISADDGIATCWHPSCNFRVTSEMIREREEKSIYYCLEVISNVFHAALMDQKDKEGQSAYNYLVKERKIHEDVVANALIGVVPEEFSLDELCMEVIGNYNLQISAARGDSEKRVVEDELMKTKEYFEKLKKLFTFNKGWICLFHTDEKYRIVEIKLRKPCTKEFTSFKIRNGIFSLGFVTEKDVEESTLLVVEGQFNLLQLQSMQRRLALEGEEAKYVNAIAVGSANQIAYDTIKKINRNPIINWDSDDAGFAVVSNARNFMHVSGFRTPHPYNDLDEYIRGFGDDHSAAKIAIENLIDERQYYYRYFAPLAKEVKVIRSSKKKDFLIQQEVSDLVLDDMLQRGRFFLDNSENCYFFNEEKKELCILKKEENSISLLMSKYKLISTETIFKYVISNLEIETLENGKKTSVHRFACYDKQKFKLYLYNNSNQIYIITKDKIELADNGVDGVLFINDNQWEPFELKDTDENSNYFESIIVDQINFSEDDILSIEDRKLIFKTWIYGLFFETLMPTKAILTVIGGKGSGKSSSIRKTGIVLFGRNFDLSPLNNDPRDFDTTVSNSYLVGVDNCDSKSEWFEDRAAVVSTGGRIKKRSLYSDNKMIEIETHCFLALTSRSGNSFHRDDVADRLLIMKVGRIENFKAENIILAEVIDNRDIILSEITKELKGILRVLEEQKDARFVSKLRMADFADFAYKVATKDNNELIMENIFNKISKGQSEFTLETDPIVDLISEWLTEKYNQGRLVTLKELYDDLNDLSTKSKETFLYKSHRSLAQKLRNIKSNLENYFIIKEHIGAARERKISFDYKLTEEIQEIKETQETPETPETPGMRLIYKVEKLNDDEDPFLF